MATTSGTTVHLRDGTIITITPHPGRLRLTLTTNHGGEPITLRTSEAREYAQMLLAMTRSAEATATARPTT